MAALYADENFPFPVVEALRRLGHDVLTSQEAGNAGRAVPDAQVLAVAVTQQRTLLTINHKQLIRLHRDAPGHSGIIICIGLATPGGPLPCQRTAEISGGPPSSVDMSRCSVGLEPPPEPIEWPLVSLLFAAPPGIELRGYARQISAVTPLPGP